MCDLPIYIKYLFLFAARFWPSEYIISDSQTVLPGEVNSASGDVASTMALASFCSNSINESAIAQENSTK